MHIVGVYKCKQQQKSSLQIVHSLQHFEQQ